MSRLFRGDGKPERKASGRPVVQSTALTASSKPGELLIIVTMAVLVFPFLAEPPAHKQPPSKEELAAITQRGRDLAGFDSAAWRASVQGFGRVKDALLAATAGELPLIFAAKEALLSSDVDTRFEWSIDLIIDGIVRGRPPASRAGKARGNGGRNRRSGSAPPRP